ncbi:protein TPX2 isoform X1 [Prosopis cineraria]|uniref:protein TPX2 isoform X1 n=1 Tax=Prosopis cineraria TaxID=364024 RepID=UPI00240EC936|nr:protein TPX2 isoform X1 [Prosopis cineraria]
MAVAEEITGAITMIDETYEFSAPRFFDFTKSESEEDTSRAELWFETALSYAPSPFMPKIKTGRSITVESLCDFSEANKMQKTSASTDLKADNNNNLDVNIQPQCMSAEVEEGELSSEVIEENNMTAFDVVSAKMERSRNDYEGEGACSSDNNQPKCTINKLKEDAHCREDEVSGDMERSHPHAEGKSACLNPVGASIEVVKEACTPNPSIALQKRVTTTISKKQETAKKIAALVKNPSALKTKAQLQSSALKTKLPSSAAKTKPQLLSSTTKSAARTSHLSQENQAIKRQKLEGGRARQILNVKPQNLPHKSKLSSAASNASSSSNASKTNKEDRKVYVRETPTPASLPFVSMAEMMRKFQSSTRDLSLPNVNIGHSQGDAGSMIQTKPKLTLTRPKEPEFETAQRARSIKVKSTSELEEEMMAKMPKFKARPLNKKILQAPTVPIVPRSTPQPPEFKEFHLETAARANQNADSASVASGKSSHQEPWKPHLTEPKTPLLQTSLRARPPKVKSSLELEQEELEKVPKFKARPLNKKIFESKGDIGIFCHTKKFVTQPREFHFATNERIPPPSAVVDLFDKLSLNSEPAHKNPIPRNTIPNPFHLYTEERGAEKEKRLLMELQLKQLEEERTRVPKANPYPYTTDYPVIPPKPEPKPCTKAEPFQLESLVRHEEEMEREMEERQRKEREEAEMRIFRAQPILKEDPIPVPEKARKPLTQVQEFNLRVNDRAVDRAEFDQRIKEKEMMYKRYREESEAARMIEEEKALKQLRRTLVPHARPVPNFDHPFVPQKSVKEATKAKSPHLRVIHRKERRKFVLNGRVASSPASSIR